MLLEIAIADAYGLGFEFTPQEYVDKENDLAKYRQHPKYTELTPGMYSDDTQMSIAVTKLLMKEVKDCYTFPKNIETILTPEKFADAFLEEFHLSPRKGYAKGFQFVLEKVGSGKEMIEVIESFGKTTSNGAAMRAMPIGLFFMFPQQVVDVAAIQASVTHEGSAILAAQLVALATFYMKHRLPINSVLKQQELAFRQINLMVKETKIASEPIDFHFDGSRVTGKEDLGMKSAIAGIFTAITSESYSECLHKAVSYGGDTDSVAAIACGIFAAKNNLTPVNKTLPGNLVDALEQGPCGLSYLINLDNKLKKYI